MKQMSRLLKDNFPDLVHEWDYNKNSHLDINSITYGSGKTANWICSHNTDHRWSSLIKSRTRKDRPGKCPFCSKIKVSTLCDKFSEFINECWCYNLNSQNPNNITEHSKILAWWKCKHGHVFESRIDNVISSVNTKSRGCPFCAGVKICSDNSLQNTYPNLIKEWDFDKNTLSPTEVTTNSSHLAWWKCSRGHSWKTKICHRTRKDGKATGCPFCNESHGEKKIAEFLSSKNIVFERQKRFDSCKYKIPLPFDFYIPSSNTCIEFDGIQHFEVREIWGGQKELEIRKICDNIKTLYCSNTNLKLIRIKFDQINDIETILQNALL